MRTVICIIDGKKINAVIIHDIGYDESIKKYVKLVEFADKEYTIFRDGKNWKQFKNEEKNE